MITEHVSFTSGDPLQPEELDLLQRVFDLTCAEVGIEKKSRQAEGLAATLLKLFQSGTRDERELKAAVAKIDFI
ncbi:hypothetical protein [Neorhizobium galegae]|uniref:hypothetical protein n=1 Tax=Neorhizobium galegae TaxID=399 RepID=UPI0006276942|nr:hypothetical protein [Neorhizobium galegae]KAA9384130.1 hypothetical protein F4V88_28320 [Neorhizobium galegae]KAB1109307.1 hypothetical protein F4V89_27865 [Neorhizobium galegae]MCM2498784.1 hypothetical protein [Neorhizobium galegae]MCQ1766807.1 hypothetical protein [Neorhizobium galegae]MCQ1781382.1 hypothetical protein [Neorhizobium galegae]